MAQATDGYFAQGFGMKSNGMAGAGIALPQDSMAGAINPAGMVMVGNRVDLGLTLFRPDRGADISGNCLNPAGCATTNISMDGTYDGNGRVNFLIPEFGYNKMINPNMSLGVSVYGNGGLNSKYTKNPYSAFSFATGGNSEAAGINMTQLFIAPTWAMKVNETNSIGVALNLVYQTFSAIGLQAFNSFPYTSNQGAVTDNGTDSSTGMGVRLGWTGEITPAITLGASYQPKTSMSKFSKYAGLFANQGGFDIPSTYGAGIAFKATPTTTLAADYMVIKYTDVATVGNPVDALFNSTKTSVANAYGTNNGPGFGWTDVSVIKLGVSHVMSDAFTVRAGYSHNTQPIPNSQALINILAPGVVQDHLTLGTTWNVSKQNEVTVAYMHAFEKTVGSPNNIPATAVGFGGGTATIHMHEDSLGVAYSWKL
jgi:long-chain fatty acid transport protein